MERELQDLSKKERKLLKAALKLEKITKKYMEQLTEIDEIMQKLPRQTVSCYSLEDRYFRHVPVIASAGVKMELLASHLEEELLGSEEEDDFEAERCNIEEYLNAGLQSSEW